MTTVDFVVLAALWVLYLVVFVLANVEQSRERRNNYLIVSLAISCVAFGWIARAVLG